MYISQTFDFFYRFLVSGEYCISVFWVNLLFDLFRIKNKIDELYGFILSIFKNVRCYA